ncbi:precorrin-3B synthase [Kitasatospora cineracea]|uniref:Precorrin-3B synthase n=1 Tax=Kitasatospora cineracea TaxID=88074 RepID=A0A8G1UAZ8_9ACTN|nr:precorrin-3B synthase [Kitasatospora cineracea]
MHEAVARAGPMGMLAAMPPTPDAAQAPSVGPDRGRADACPGALRLHPAEDGHLARLRLPGGQLTHRQLLAVADAADTLGDGEAEITSRGNLQLRGLAAGCAADLAERLRTVGLLPSDTHERVRNIVASPLAGLDGRGAGGNRIADWVRELDQALCAAPWAAALSGKFLFALDDGRGDVAALNADVTLLAVGDGRALLRLGRARRATAVHDPVPAALDAARRFLDLAAGRAWHPREIQDELPDGDVPLPPFAGEPPALGAVPGGLSVAPRLGRLGSAQWRLLAEALGDTSPHPARLTPWRGAVLPHADPHWLPRLADAGLRTTPGGPWEGVTACTGLPGCAKSLADVRAQAARAVAAVPAEGLPVHWSGCARRCGHPAGRWVDVLATAAGHRVTVDGTVRDTEENDTAEAVAEARNTPWRRPK